MFRKNLLKSLSLVVALTMAIVSTGCSANVEDNALANKNIEETSEENMLEEAISTQEVLNKTDENAGKVETVYVLADANGEAGDVIVSEWLKNEDYSANILDQTNLTDIVNVKGDETYTKNEDGTITWDAEGNDIYYQGTSDKELPLNVNITYTLDGNEISPEDLVGKTGKVTIKFDYENNSKQDINVDGKDVEVYTPFAVVSGTMLDGDKFSNVEISNGKVISEGNKYIVMGVAVPGLKESLNISDENWEKLNKDGNLSEKLSNSFEITADVKDFSLDTTITMASSNILSDFGASDVVDTSKVDDIKDDFTTLSSSSTKLVNGACDLKDGTDKLSSGAYELNTGASKLQTGSLELKNGALKLSDGTTLFKTGLLDYTNGSYKINDGAKKLSEGTLSAKEGSVQLSGGIQSAKEGADKLVTGTTQVKDGVQTLTTSISDMTSKSLQNIETSQNCLNAVILYMQGQLPYNQQVAAGLTIIGLNKDSVDKIILDNTNAYKTLNTLSQTMQEKTKEMSDANTKLQNGINQINAAKQALSDSSQKSQDDPDADVLSASRADNLPEDETQPEDVTQPKDETQPEDSNEDNKEDDASDESKPQPVQEPQQQDKQPVQEENIPAQPVNEENKDSNEENKADETKENVSEENASEEKVLGDNTEITQLREELNKANETVGVLQTQLSNLNTKSNTQQTIIDNQSSVIDNQQQMINTMLQFLSTSNMTQEITNATTAISTYQSYLSAAKSAYTTLDTVKSMLPNVSDGAMAAKLNLLVQGTKDLENGMTTLDNGLSKLVDGGNKLSDGLNTLNNGANALSEGTNTLVSNNDALIKGASDLEDGALKLSGGMDQLDNGIGTLYEGTNTLYDGTKQLDDGAKQLLDGLVKFDEEGIQKLYEAFDGDLGEFTDRIEALKIAGQNYTSFGGANDSENSTVKFIIKTDEIG